MSCGKDENNEKRPGLARYEKQQNKIIFHVFNGGDAVFSFTAGQGVMSNDPLAVIGKERESVCACGREEWGESV